MTSIELYAIDTIEEFLHELRHVGVNRVINDTSVTIHFEILPTENSADTIHTHFFIDEELICTVQLKWAKAAIYYGSAFYFNGRLQLIPGSNSLEFTSNVNSSNALFVDNFTALLKRWCNLDYEFN